MIIRRLHATAFGVWHELELAAISGRLHVIYGPNEAGKTTLLHFIRTMLYGFSPERRRRYLPPLVGDRAGGWLELEADGAGYRIERHDQPHHPGSDELLVGGPDGEARDAEALETLLGGIDEDVYTRVFAVGLRELQELATLDDERSAQLLYDLAAGLERVRLPEVLSELQAARGRLWAGRDNPSQLARLLTDYEQACQRRDELQSQTAEYGRLVARRDELDTELERLEGAARHERKRLHTLEAASGHFDRWRRRQSIEQQLALLGALPPMPVDGIVRLEELNGRIQTRRKQLRLWRKRKSQVQKRLRAARPAKALVQSAARVTALLEQQNWLTALEQQIANLEHEAEQARRETAGALGKLGLDPARIRSMPELLSGRMIGPLRKAAKAVREAKQQVDEAEQEIGKARQENQQLAQQLRAAGRESPENLEARVQGAGEQVSQLRRRIQLEERLDELARQRAALEAQSYRLEEQEMLSPAVIVGLGAVFVIGAVLVLAGLFLPIAGTLGWPMALLGLCGVIGAGVFKLVLERRAKREAASCEQQLEVLARELAQAAAERDELDARLPRGGGPLAVRLQAAQRELAELENLLPARARRAVVEQDLEAAEAILEEARAHLSAARQQWSQAARQAGLPESFSPQSLRALADALEQIAEHERRLAYREAELAERRQQHRALVERIDQAVLELGIDSPAERPAERLAQLAAELRRHEAASEERRKRRRQLRRASRACSRAARGVAALKTRRRALLAQAGTGDEAQFRRLAAQHAQASQLQQELDRLRAELTDQAGESLDSVVHTLSTFGEKAELEGQRGDVAETLAATESTLRELAEERGRVGQQIDALAEDRRPAIARLEMDALEERIRQTVEDYQVRTVVERLFERVREKFESERQPETLRRASEYFQQMTRGRYQRVWTPLDERVLRVETADSQTLRVESLSRGTREQLFLSLRLAMIDQLSERGAALPVVLDDVLVNFDLPRAKTAAAVLREFAEAGHQVLVFTCHEHIVKLFKSQRAEVTQLPARGELAEAEAAEPPSRSRRPAGRTAAAELQAGRAEHEDEPVAGARRGGQGRPDANGHANDPKRTRSSERGAAANPEAEPQDSDEPAHELEEAVDEGLRAAANGVGPEDSPAATEANSSQVAALSADSDESSAVPEEQDAAPAAAAEEELEPRAQESDASLRESPPEVAAAEEPIPEFIGTPWLEDVLDDDQGWEKV